MAASVTVSYRVADVDTVARASRTVVQGAQAAAKEAAKASAAAAKESAKAQAEAAKEGADAQKAAARAAGAFEREMNKASAAAFKARVKEQTDAARKAVQQQAADARKVAQQQAADERKAVKGMATLRREAERATERDRKLAERHSTAAGKAAEATAAGAQNRRRAAVGEIGAGAANGFKRGVGVLAGGAALATGGLGVGTIVSAVKAQMELGERAALLENSSGLGKNQTGTNKFDAVAQAKKISSMTGVDAGEVMGGFEKIAAKGGGTGLSEAAAQMERLAKVAYGAGINMTDLGDAVGTLVVRGVKGEELVTTVESLVQQGKDGAVEFNQLAKLLDASSGALGRFKMDDKERILTAGGLSQMARTYGQKSGEEATTSVKDIAAELGGKADIIQKLTGGSATTVATKGKVTKKLVNGKMVTTTEGGGTQTQYKGGVEVGTDETRSQLRSFNDLLPEIIMGAIQHGNVGKLMGEGGVFSGTSTAIATPMIEAATMGIKKDKGGRYQIVGEGEKSELKGMEAMKAMLAQFSSADVAKGTTDKAFALRAGTDTGQFKIAMETLTNDLGTKLQPRIAQLVPSVVKLASTFGEATIWIAENPKKAAAAFVGLTTVLGGLEATAGVAAKTLGGWALDKMLPKLVPTMNVAATNVNVVGGGASGAGGAAAAAGGGMGKAKSVAGVLGAVGLGAALGIGAGELAAGSIEGDLAKRDSTAIEGGNLASKLRMGTATDADRAKAQTTLDEMKSNQDRGVAGRFLKNASAGLTGLFDGSAGLNMQTAGNLASLIPPVAMARGVVGGALEGQQQELDKNNPAAIAELTAALAANKPTIDPASIAAMATAVGAAVGKAGGRDPATAPINGPK